ncbi:CLUMA_CG003690, isoform A [Clunio marinus]|uniref:CLUMA_CG003690, isoform A n=1 Tax=Clunio marinus TaxID=568069 RepID=A0A1J1HQZ5_9DIPT|nr:CLUMA_CG003690, isoform A [Clunio marinus]
MTHNWYPPTYYNHFLEHPILWSPERRRSEEQRLAHECFEVWKTQERVKRSEKLKNQSEYREMVNNWNPWGQPGNGAPNMDTRIRNLEMDGLFPADKNVVRQSQTLPRIGKNKYLCTSMTAVSGGSGAPLRNESGRLLVPLREDPLITFSDSTRNYVDKDLRYRTTPAEQNAYRQDLDRIVEEKKRMRYNEKNGIGSTYRNNYEDPWGRPGPGGTPWRDPKNIGHNFMKSMGWTTKDTLKSLNNEMNDGKHLLDEDQIYHPPKLALKKPPMPCCDRCSCQCIKKIESTILRDNSPPKIKENYRCEFEEVNKSPKKLPHYALPQHCNRQQPLEPLQPIQTSSKPKRKKSPTKKLSKASMISGGVELVPLLAKRRDERPISLSTTDITKYKINKSSWHDGDPEYLNDLERQVVQKQKLRQISHERDVESSRCHFKNFDSFWGRPGCGAPQNNKNKLKLDDLLYNTPMYQHF